MYQTYSLTRAFDADDMRAQTFAVSDDDAINCAHMLAAGFNTMSRNHMLSFVMAVVDTETGIVQYNGTTEQIQRPEPWSTSQTFTLNATSVDPDTILTLLGEDGKPTFTAAGKFSAFAETATDDEVMSKAADDLAKASYGHIARSVLESAYVELQRAQDALFEAGFETIPAERGVKDMHSIIRSRDAQISELAQELVNANERIAELERRDEHERYARQTMERKHIEEAESIRSKMIAYARGSYEKLRKVDPNGERADLQGRYRGALDMLAQYLVATGEADHDERHAAARRLVEKPED
jgi:hypothetical protein